MYRPLPICPICKIDPVRAHHRKTCGASSCLSGYLKIVSGGYRERAGRGKMGHYRGIFCNSQWELAYLIWMFDHGREVVRNTIGYPYTDPDSGKQRKFYPDFIVDGGLVEIKGWGRRAGINEAKMAAVDRPIRFLFETDLEEVFSYIAQKYGKSRYNVYELYEERVKNTMVTCEFCSNEFEKPRRGKGIYCSRSCSIKANHSSNRPPVRGIEPACLG